MATPATKLTAKQQLELELIKCYPSPLRFVKQFFPWGEPGPLSKFKGPDVWQTKTLQKIEAAIRKGASLGDPAIRLAIASGHGIGKAHPVDMVLDTPDGRRCWGDLKPGDRLFGRDGQAVSIEAIYPQGVRPTYRVTFDDESSAVTCAEHQWSVYHRKRGWQIRNTLELLDAEVRVSNGPGRLRKYHLPRYDAVRYEYQWTHVDPYTLGAWLGDGSRNTSRITGMDAEVFDRIRAAGYRLTENNSKSCGRASVFNVGHLRPALERLGIDKCRASEKYVPIQYKHNLIEIRAEVLRGLIDTDGFVTPSGTVQFTSASKLLVEDVMWLTRSLGGKARLYKTIKNNAYTCSLTFPDDFQPCYIERKLARIRPTTQKRYLERYIDRIEPDGEAECMCVTVDSGDSLYLANDFIVTHNTALVSWIILWFISTRPRPQIVVTANTQSQLTTKTWRELAKWKDMLLHGDWFIYTATQLKLIDRKDTWFATAVPWSAANSSAFAGTHENHVLVIMDEASEIADIIWEVSEGAMTTPGAMWFAFGNPTSNTGRFRQCWTKFRHRWIRDKVDSRDAMMADRKQIEEWIEDYGIDSDFVKVRVLGEFPSAGTKQFIASGVVQGAIDRRSPDHPNYIDPRHIPARIPKIMGIDVGSYGGAQTIIGMRHGPFMLGKITKLRDANHNVIAGYIGRAINEWEPDLVFIDATGYGHGVWLLLQQNGFDQVIPIYWGDRSMVMEPLIYYNPRVEIWHRMAKWLETGSIPDDSELFEDLIGPMLNFDIGLRMRLESKEDMAKRGLPSPDIGDSLALTFAHPVPVSLAGESLEETEPEEA